MRALVKTKTGRSFRGYLTQSNVIFRSQQVARTDTPKLARATIALFDLQCQLKQGVNDSSLPHYLMAIASK